MPEPAPRTPVEQVLHASMTNVVDALTTDARRIRSAGPWLSVLAPAELASARPREPGWWSCAALLEELPGWQSQIETDLRSKHPAVHPSVPATYLMGFYLDVVCRTGALWLGLCDRVPDLSPASLWVRISGGGWPVASGVSGTRVAVLSGDVLTSPEAVVVADRAELLAEYHRQVRRHAEQFQAAFDPRVRVGSRQRLGMLADMIEAALWSVGDLTGDPFAAADQAESLVGANPTRTRRSCCFAYRLDPGFLCHRCPRRRSVSDIY